MGSGEWEWGNTILLDVVCLLEAPWWVSERSMGGVARLGAGRELQKEEEEEVPINAEFVGEEGDDWVVV